MAILTLQKAIALLHKYKVPENIVRHSSLTKEIASFIATKLRENGYNVDVAAVEAAALLHDIDKIKTLKAKELHGKKGYEILIKEGFPKKIAEIVKKHRVDTILNKGKDGLQNLEEIIVYYADKRADEDRVVPLEKRFAKFIIRTDAKTKGELKRALELTKQIEEDLLKLMKITKEEFEKKLKGMVSE